MENELETEKDWRLNVRLRKIKFQQQNSFFYRAMISFSFKRDKSLNSVKTADGYEYDADKWKWFWLVLFLH